MGALAARSNAQRSIPDAHADALVDLRFRNLLSSEDWAALPAATRRRFSKRVCDGHSVVYAGALVEMRMTAMGWLIAQLLRPLGDPLPRSCDCGLPAIVTVTEDMAHGGQFWTRLYARRSGFPQVIQSSKRFAGATGLEEHVGRGLAMALSVRAHNGALLFESVRYFIRLGRLRLTVPACLSPGALTVSHAEADGGRFVFTLDIVHPLLGRILHQRAVFSEIQPSAPRASAAD
jgi:hypothetical protein